MNDLDIDLTTGIDDLSDIFGELGVKKSVFKFEEMFEQIGIDPLYDDPKYLFDYLVDQHVNKIVSWINDNPHHTFAKSIQAWKNVIYHNFRNCNVKMDVDKIVYMAKTKKKVKSSILADLLKRIRGLLRRSAFAIPSHPRTRRNLKALCYLPSYANVDTIFKRMVERGIVTSFGQIPKRRAEQEVVLAEPRFKRRRFA